MSAEANDGAPVKILLVEDSLADATLVREYLEEAQPGAFHLTRAKRMSEALEILGTERFAVILLDLSLPDCNGIQSFERLVKPAGLTPIIVLTGLEDTATEKQLVVRGARDYLRKRHLGPKLLAAVVLHAAKKR